jgi:hypothetical protein
VRGDFPIVMFETCVLDLITSLKKLGPMIKLHQHRIIQLTGHFDSIGQASIRMYSWTSISL